MAPQVELLVAVPLQTASSGGKLMNRAVYITNSSAGLQSWQVPTWHSPEIGSGRSSLDDGSSVLTTSGGRSGDSAEFDVQSGALDHFAWDTISSPRYQDAPFPVTVTAQDVNDFTVRSFTTTVNLSGLAGTSTEHLFLSNTTWTSSSS